MAQKKEWEGEGEGEGEGRWREGGRGRGREGPFYRLENEQAVLTCVDIIFSPVGSHAPAPQSVSWEPKVWMMETNLDGHHFPAKAKYLMSIFQRHNF